MVWLENSLSQTFSRINTSKFSTTVILHTYPPMKMEETECFETLAYKIQTPGIYPEESIQCSEHGESLKSKIKKFSTFDRHLTKPRMSICEQPPVYLAIIWEPNETFCTSGVGDYMELAIGSRRTIQCTSFAVPKRWTTLAFSSSVIKVTRQAIQTTEFHVVSLPHTDSMLTL